MLSDADSKENAESKLLKVNFAFSKITSSLSTEAMVGADVFLQFTFSSAKFYFQHAGSLLSAYCILSASLNTSQRPNLGMQVCEA